jgi:hypothetical protein
VHDVQIEVLLLSVSVPASGGAQLRWRVARGDLPTECQPDARARELAGLGTNVPTATVVHSTSWRHGPAGLILTYAVLPDPNPAEGTPVPPDAYIVCSADAAAPTPTVVAMEHVLAHALRHLSLVARTCPAVAVAVDLHSQLWHAVSAHAPHVAGQLVGS